MCAQDNAGPVLGRILEARRAEVEHRKKVLPETALKYGVQAASPLRDLISALSGPGINVMAELKPASPSRGLLREPFDPVGLAASLESVGAAALSVLTEPEFFRGSLKNLRDARKSVKLPVLRKDFIFDSWQVWETRANDADSFLLIVATLADAQLKELLALGRELGMEPVVEVHTREELETQGWRLEGNLFVRDGSHYVPLYEAKLVSQFNHRSATFDGIPASERFKTHAGTNPSTRQELSDPHHRVIPRFWVPGSVVESAVPARNQVSA